MNDFAISGYRVEVPEWANAGLGRAHEDLLKDALLDLPGATSVTLHTGGWVDFEGEYTGATLAAMAVEKVCREHAVNPPAIELPTSAGPGARGVVELPFLISEDGKTVVYSADGGTRLGDAWTGICCDASDVKSLWYIGRSHGERSFTKLQARTLAEANLESAKVRESEAQEPAPLARLTPEHFEFLHWFNNTQFFRDNLVEGLVEAGENELSARFTSISGAAKSADVVRFVQEYAGKPEALQKFIQKEFDDYCRISNRRAAAPKVPEEALQAEPDMLFGHNKGAVYRYPAVGGVAAGYEWWATTDQELIGMPEDQDARDRRGARLALCANACREFADPVAEIGKLRSMAADLVPVQAQQVGAAFESLLWERLGEENYREAAERNRRETNPLICHTHDFCDANQVMMDAFEKVLGREPDIQSPTDMQVFDAAWAIGRQRLESNAHVAVQRADDGPSL